MRYEQEPMRIVKDPNGIEPDRLISETQYQRELQREYDREQQLEEEAREEAYRLHCIESGIPYKSPAQLLGEEQQKESLKMFFFYVVVTIFGIAVTYGAYLIAPWLGLIVGFIFVGAVFESFKPAWM